MFLFMDIMPILSLIFIIMGFCFSFIGCFKTKKRIPFILLTLYFILNLSMMFSPFLFDHHHMTGKTQLVFSNLLGLFMWFTLVSGIGILVFQKAPGSPTCPTQNDAHSATH